MSKKSILIPAVILLLIYTAIEVYADSYEYRSGSLSLELITPADEIEFGPSVDFILRVSYPADRQYILLPLNIDADERYKNTLRTGVRKNVPVLDGRGGAVDEIIFSVEAWLPGRLVFPPLTIQLDGAVTTGEAITTDAIITTDEVSINVLSAIEDGENEPELAPLWAPKPPADLRRIILITAALLTAAALIVFAVFKISRYRKSKKTAAASAPKTRLQMLVDFRIKYIDSEEIIDLKEAYAELAELLSDEEHSQYKNLIEKARFSKEGLVYQDGYRLLVQIFGRLNSGGDNHEL